MREKNLRPGTPRHFYPLTTISAYSCWRKGEWQAGRCRSWLETPGRFAQTGQRENESPALNNGLAPFETEGDYAAAERHSPGSRSGHPRLAGDNSSLSQPMIVANLGCWSSIAATTPQAKRLRLDKPRQSKQKCAANKTRRMPVRSVTWLGSLFQGDAAGADPLRRASAGNREQKIPMSEMSSHNPRPGFGTRRRPKRKGGCRKRKLSCAGAWRRRKRSRFRCRVENGRGGKLRWCLRLAGGRQEERRNCYAAATKHCGETTGDVRTPRVFRTQRCNGWHTTPERVSYGLSRKIDRARK